MAKIPRTPEKELDAERSDSDDREFQLTEEDRLLVSQADTDEYWEQPMNLVAPPPRPGYEQYWVRAALGDQTDSINFARAKRKGWMPRRADTVDPEFYTERITHGKFAGVIGANNLGLVLCERPVSIGKREREFLARKSASQRAAITRDFEQLEDKRMPQQITMRAKVTRGGRRPPVRRDDPPPDNDLEGND